MSVKIDMPMPIMCAACVFSDEDSFTDENGCLDNGAVCQLTRAHVYDTHLVGRDSRCPLRDASRYEWHDLRKNPDDLPKENSPVRLWVKHTYYSEDDGYRRIINGVYLLEHERFSLRTHAPDSYTPIAWKYEEPFEEVEE